MAFNNSHNYINFNFVSVPLCSTPKSVYLPDFRRFVSPQIPILTSLPGGQLVLQAADGADGRHLQVGLEVARFKNV